MTMRKLRMNMPAYAFEFKAFTVQDTGLPIQRPVMFWVESSAP
jgi:hypothetical protein